MDHIGQRIKKLRQTQGMSQRELGSILGVGKAAVQKYEANPNPNLSADKIRLLSTTFRVFPRMFIFNDQEEFWSSVFSLNESSYYSLSREFESLRHEIKEVDEIFSRRILELNRTIAELNAVGFEKAEGAIGDLAKIDEYRNHKYTKATRQL